MASEDDYPALPPGLAGEKKRKRSQENDLRRLEELAKGVIRFKPLQIGGDSVGAHAGATGTVHVPHMDKAAGKGKKSQNGQQSLVDPVQPEGSKKGGRSPAGSSHVAPHVASHVASHVDKAGADPATLKNSRKEKRRNLENTPQGEPTETPASLKKSRKEKRRNREPNPQGEPGLARKEQGLEGHPLGPESAEGKEGGDTGAQSDARRKHNKERMEQGLETAGGAGGVDSDRQGKRKKRSQQEGGAPGRSAEERSGEGREGNGLAEGAPMPQGKKSRKDKHGEPGHEGAIRQTEGVDRQFDESAPQGKKRKHTKHQAEGLDRPPADSVLQGKKKKHVMPLEVPRGAAHSHGQAGDRDVGAGEGDGATAPGQAENGSTPPGSAQLPGRAKKGSTLPGSAEVPGLSEQVVAPVPQRKSKNKFLAQARGDDPRFSTSKRPARPGGKAQDGSLPLDATDAPIAKGEKTSGVAAASMARGKKDAAKAPASGVAAASMARGKKDAKKASTATRKEAGDGNASGLAVSSPPDKPPEKVFARRAIAVLEHLMQGGTVQPGVLAQGLAATAGPGADAGVLNASGSQSLHNSGERRRPEVGGGGERQSGALRSREASKESPALSEGAAEGSRDARHSGLMGAGSARKTPTAGSNPGGAPPRGFDHSREGADGATRNAGKAGGPSMPKGPSEATGVTGEMTGKGDRRSVSVRMQAAGEKAGKSGGGLLPGRTELTGEKAGGKRRGGLVSGRMEGAREKTCKSGGGSLLGRMQQQLQGGFFRYLNEQLYTTDGHTALQMMQDQPQLYEEYHKGFRKQTEGWPLQPVDVAIQWLKEQDPGLGVADFGCGDARLAASVPQAVHSLDLVAGVPGVIACNMAHTPLGTASVDVAIFCLALMGTDYPSFLKEAARVLRPGGTLWIAEVRSRFAGREGTEDPGPFLAALRTLGFVPVHRDMSNTMFVTFILEKRGKGGPNLDPAVWPTLKPCIYKRR